MANKKSKNGKISKKEAQKAIKRIKGLSARQIICLTLFMLFAITYLGGLFFYEDKIDDHFGFRKIETYDKGDVVEIGSLNIHFIDVGQGDACLIELPDDKTVLIDAGEYDTRVRNKLSEYIDNVNTTRELRENKRPRIEYFDYVIMTHSDSDHIGSMQYIIEEYPAKVFYRPNEEMVRVLSNDFIDPANYGALERNKFWGEHGKRIEKENNRGTRYMNALKALYACDGSEGIVMNPNSTDPLQNRISPNLSETDELYYEINFYGHKSASYTDTNDYSPIIILEYKDRRIALSGDCEKKGEQEFVELADEGLGRYSVFNNSNFTVDIVKLGHHGSATSSSEAYLNKIIKSDYFNNVYVVISAGEGNSYNHPHQEIMDRINSKFDQEKIKRTDLDGDIIFDLILFEGEQEALVSIGGLISDKEFYPISIFSIQVRYQNIGLAILLVVGIILFFCSLGGKSKKKKASSTSNKNGKKTTKK